MKYQQYCPNGKRFWKIVPFRGESDSTINVATTEVSLLPFETEEFSASTLAQTTGTGAQITLDDDAAGYGWFIDPTPSDNDEFLPTSNPHEWIAKPGSDAAGKMDLVTVLLHEYGHAQGLDHSVDAHDLMATTLLPGIRRLPTDREWEALRGLLASAGVASVPYDPSHPPGAPLPVSHSLAGPLRSARQRPTGVSPADPAGLTQFDTAANPTLTNPNFAHATAWTTTGAVTFTPGAATLKETPTTQTRLSQTFVLGETDRTLRFTLSAIALDDVDHAPDDAFEVALIDANTGRSLLASTGLTHNDAFLNLQADGSETKSSGVTTIRNPDGSRTVLVDLAGVHANAPAGTVVNLSFDLIGFGRGTAAVSSRVTVKDLHLGLPQEGPQARDDSATTAEDTPIDLDVTANDTVTGPATPILVTGPAHGTVDLTADGHFRYTPAADWTGEDTFSYRLVDGRADASADANLATVTLTVTPVNDAPVIAARTVTLDEDTPVTVDLLAGAADVDGDALSIALTTAPQHGRVTQNPDGRWTYTPVADWSGSDTVGVELSDGTVSTAAQIEFNVTPVNDAPTLGRQTLTGQEDTPLTGHLLATAADTDSSTLTARVLSGPRHGTLTVSADGGFTYTPDADWHGSDTFTCQVSDGALDSAVADVILTLAPVNDAPVVRPLAATLLEDGRLTLDLLAQASDVDGDALTITVAQPGDGRVTPNPDGTWTYRPPADWHGSDTFSFTASDGEFRTLGVVHLTVTAVNDAPVARDDVATLPEDGRLILDLLSNDSDVDGDPLTLTLTLTSPPAHGTLIENADHRFTYVPAANWSGEDAFTYRLSDGQATSSLATVRLIVSPQANAPTLVLTEPPGQSREIFRTGWESVVNRNRSSTLVQDRQLDGWTLVTRPDPSAGGTNGFEIWSTGDQMMDLTTYHIHLCMKK
ncbi:MAG: tandem-95 repeat protein [Candidatus Contendobacter sp.]|nr:tandem-95 repeat protein [Candidatus Contendobacter sp.]